MKRVIVFVCTFLTTYNSLHAQAKLGSGKLSTIYASDSTGIRQFKGFEYVGFVADLLQIEYRDDSATLCFSYAIFGDEGRVKINEKTEKGVSDLYSWIVTNQKSGIVSFTVPQKDMAMLRIEVFILYKKQSHVFYDFFSVRLKRTLKEQSHL